MGSMCTGSKASLLDDKGLSRIWGPFIEVNLG